MEQDSGVMIVLVCTGNTCRSPMAHYYIQNLVEKESLELAVLSRGVAVTGSGEKANSNAVETLAHHGIVSIASHEAKQVVAADEDIAAADLIVVMTKDHRDQLINICKDAEPKIKLLQSFVGKPDDDISDPLGSDLPEYAACLDAMKPALDVIAHLTPNDVVALLDTRPPLFDDWEDAASDDVGVVVKSTRVAAKDESDNESLDSWGLPCTLPKKYAGKWETSSPPSLAARVRAREEATAAARRA